MIDNKRMMEIESYADRNAWEDLSSNQKHRVILDVILIADELHGKERLIERLKEDLADAKAGVEDARVDGAYSILRMIHEAHDGMESDLRLCAHYTCIDARREAGLPR